MPGGKSFSTVCDAAVTWASAVRMLTPLLKKDFDHAVAVQRLRLDVFDVGDLRGQVTLIEVDDAAGHVVGQQPVIGPHHAYDGYVDVGENVGRSEQRGQHAENRDEKREDDESVGAP